MKISKRVLIFLPWIAFFQRGKMIFKGHRLQIKNWKEWSQDKLFCIKKDEKNENIWNFEVALLDISKMDIRPEIYSKAENIFFSIDANRLAKRNLFGSVIGGNFGNTFGSIEGENSLYLSFKGHFKNGNFEFNEFGHKILHSEEEIAEKNNKLQNNEGQYTRYSVFNFLEEISEKTKIEEKDIFKIIETEYNKYFKNILGENFLFGSNPYFYKNCTDIKSVFHPATSFSDFINYCNVVDILKSRKPRYNIDEWQSIVYKKIEDYKKEQITIRENSAKYSFETLFRFMKNNIPKFISNILDKMEAKDYNYTIRRILKYRFDDFLPENIQTLENDFYRKLLNNEIERTTLYGIILEAKYPEKRFFVEKSIEYLINNLSINESSIKKEYNEIKKFVQYEQNGTTRIEIVSNTYSLFDEDPEKKCIKTLYASKIKNKNTGIETEFYCSENKEFVLIMAIYDILYENLSGYKVPDQNTVKEKLNFPDNILNMMTKENIHGLKNIPPQFIENVSTDSKSYHEIWNWIEKNNMDDPIVQQVYKQVNKIIPEQNLKKISVHTKISISKDEKIFQTDWIQDPKMTKLNMKDKEFKLGLEKAEYSAFNVLKKILTENNISLDFDNIKIIKT